MQTILDIAGLILVITCMPIIWYILWLVAQEQLAKRDREREGK